MPRNSLLRKGQYISTLNKQLTLTRHVAGLLYGLLSVQGLGYKGKKHIFTASNFTIAWVSTQICFNFTIIQEQKSLVRPNEVSQLLSLNSRTDAKILRIFELP